MFDDWYLVTRHLGLFTMVRFCFTIKTCCSFVIWKIQD